MKIGEVARRSQLSSKTVRYYADIGLVAPSGRSSAGYRQYDEAEVRKLVFVRRARAFGFSVDECRELLGLYEDRQRPSREVKRLAQLRIDDIDQKLSELHTLRDELAHLVSCCKGDDRPDCPILEGLSEQ